MISDAVERFFLRLGVQRQQAWLILFIFAVSLIARGGVLGPGFAIDDYTVSYDDGGSAYSTFFSQGRFLHAALFTAIDAVGVNASDIFIALGLLALLLQAAFVVSILRFVGVDRLAGAGLVGALIALHPYGTEIFTFRMGLPGYCAGLLFSIVALESIIRHPSRWTARFLAFFALLAMVFTYQVFVNYLLVTIVFTLALGEIAGGDRRAVARERALTLAAATVGSMIVLLAVMGILAGLGIVNPESRARIITVDMVPQRLWEVAATLRIIYGQAEPVMSAWLKALLWILLALSVLAIARRLWQGATWGMRSIRAAALLLVALVLIPLSLGVIILFQEWWPSYRVLAHLALIGGLILSVGDYCSADGQGLVVKRIQTVGRGLVLAVFVLMSNQIFADQRKLNTWDLLTATRLVGQLEAHPDFWHIRYVYLGGGWGGYPARLRTAFANLNASVLNASWGKAKLLMAASGYRFQVAKGEREAAGELYCSTAPTWPDRNSIKVDGDLAVVCLPK